MTVAPGFTQFDYTTALAKQGSGKGTAATTLKSGAGIEKTTDKATRQVVDGVPYQGGDAYMQEAVGVGFDVGLSFNGRVTLDMIPSLILSGMATKGTTTTINTTVQHHPWTPIKRNSGMPYLTGYGDWGETAPGSGIMTIIKRDLKATAWNITQAQAAAIEFTADFAGLNQGPGAASPTVTVDTNYHIPDPHSTVITYPAFFPTVDKICLESWNIQWNANPTQGFFCVGSGERSDNYITRMGLTGDLIFSLTTDMVAVFNTIMYGTATPTADTSQMKAGLQKGGLTFKIASLDTIAGSSPATPYSWTFTLPSVQWYVADPQDETPNTLHLVWHSFGSDWTTSQDNLTTSTNYTI